jgi:hypothetical protein
VRKTLMVEGFDKISKYKNVLDILSTIIKNQGFKGFCKGFSLPPLVVYAPSTMLWWKIYNTFFSDKIHQASLTGHDMLL